VVDPDRPDHSHWYCRVVSALRVIVGEDNILVREGLARLVEAIDGVEIVAMCADAEELLATVATVEVDVVITDIRMPPTHTDEGIRAARTIRAMRPDAGVVVLSQFVEPAYAIDLLADGTSGRAYVLKDHVDDVGRLERAIRTVAAGGSMIDDDVVAMLVRSRQRAVDSPLDALSPREVDVLREMATGVTNAAIAERLGISLHSVEKHSNAIFTKLHLSEEEGVNRRVSAVLMFLAGRSSPEQ
jgi:DNA-binding NarL/FixJ family response regulator